jgi:hypothetical protein
VVATPAPSAVTVAEERSARRALGAGVSLAILGLALVGVGPSDAGMAVTLAGLLTLIYGIHTFGRLGPEPAISGNSPGPVPSPAPRRQGSRGAR